MAEVQTVNVALGERSYPIHIGSGILSVTELIAPHIKGKQVCIVTNETVAPLYLKQLRQSLAGGDYELSEIILPDGESFKTLENITVIYDLLLERRFDRSGTLIALGGGVIGDMTGFAAATYQRGINFIQIPTTLLAQVDSSVGGKTGVNRPLGKNMVGAFHQPQCVIADIDTLNTLPDRELSAGLAEVIKYGLVNDLKFYDWLKENISNMMRRDPESLIYGIKVSCEDKASIVAQDERESGIRAILNFGHTFGHAIETAMGYGNWLHGEAVAAGMVMAADLSSRIGLLDSTAVKEIKELIKRADLPVNPPEEITVEKYLSLMSRDKKSAQGKINFIVLDEIGQGKVDRNVDIDILNQTLTASKKLAN